LSIRAMRAARSPQLTISGSKPALKHTLDWWAIAAHQFFMLSCRASSHSQLAFDKYKGEHQDYSKAQDGSANDLDNLALFRVRWKNNRSNPNTKKPQTSQNITKRNTT
jgi:hypothetical protein